MKLYCLLDYKGNFLSKYDSEIYRSGMDKTVLKKYFSKNNIDLEFIYFSEAQEFEPSFWLDKYVIYTSSEDDKFLYKSYIEDIIYYLEICGAKVIPDFKFLKANNNKVFMELLLKKIVPKTRLSVNNKVYGCYEEILPNINNLNYPLVFKQSAGAMSKGVGKVSNKSELISSLRKVSKTKNFILDVKDQIRKVKHSGYQLESNHRNKFVIQGFIPRLDGDFKVLIFGNKYYVLKRGIKPNDFRASGSGIKLFERDIPEGLLDYAREIFKEMDVPTLSIDVGFNDEDFFLIEFQALYFGTYTLMRSEFYWKEKNENFEFVEEKSILEKEYARSITEFISK